MGYPRKYRPDTAEIIKRFFVASEKAIELGFVKNVRQFCLAAHIETTHYYNQRANPDKGYFQAGWLVPLIELYNFSPYWLLTGKGAMLIQ